MKHDAKFATHGTECVSIVGKIKKRKKKKETGKSREEFEKGTSLYRNAKY